MLNVVYKEVRQFGYLIYKKLMGLVFHIQVKFS